MQKKPFCFGKRAHKLKYISSVRRNDIMGETIDYAEMLEIPVNTLNVVKKKSKKKKNEELKERVVDAVNEKMNAYDNVSRENLSGEEEMAADVKAEEESSRVAFSEDVTDYSAEEFVEPRKKPKFLEGKILIAEFAAVIALCALILITNIFMPTSAINTFFAGLVSGSEQTVKTDDRTYSELILGACVQDTDIECAVSETGVMTFKGECSVYAPYTGTVESVTEQDGVYTIGISHTTSFSTVITGLSAAYLETGDKVYSTIPVGYSKGEIEVSVSMYDDGTLITSYSVNEENDIVWNV